jgi:hypothetical protein
VETIQRVNVYLNHKRYNLPKCVDAIEVHLDGLNKFSIETILLHNEHADWYVRFCDCDGREYAIHSTAIKEKQIPGIVRLLFSWV